MDDAQALDPEKYCIVTFALLSNGEVRCVHKFPFLFIQIASTSPSRSHRPIL